MSDDKRKLWVVEAKFEDGPDRWEPCSGYCAETREECREKAMQFRKNDGTKTRIRLYRPAEKE